MRRCVFLVLVLAACGTAPSKPASDPNLVRAQIDSLDANLIRWMTAGQADSIATGYFAEDATALPAEVGPIKGSTAIRALYDSFFKAGLVRGHITINSLFAADSVATDMGTYEFTALDRADTTKVLFVDSGNYVTSFVRRHDRWRAVYRVVVTAVPTLPPAAEAKPGKKK